jgi:hypothetical protein
MKKTICLNMIVKNESAVIERCLAAVRDHIDAWAIVDTGSTDDTKEKIQRMLGHITGKLYERPWKNFGHNRSEAVAFAYESKCDYFLFIDADDVLLTPPGFRWPDLAADQYELSMMYGQYTYTRVALVSSRLKWQWVGVLHEYPESTLAAQTRGKLDEPKIRASTEGARSSDPLKYHRDAEMLEQGLREEPENTRYMFYLAQSYRDSLRLENSLAAYERRMRAGGWDEEVWRSMLEAARLKQRLSYSEADVTQSFLAAFESRPQRSEPLVDIAVYLRSKSRYSLAYVYASHAASLTMPNDRLFVERDCYDWRAKDEWAVNAYWTNRFSECASLCEQLLASGHLPDSQINRVRENLGFAKEKLR